MLTDSTIEEKPFLPQIKTEPKEEAIATVTTPQPKSIGITYFECVCMHYTYILVHSFLELAWSRNVWRNDCGGRSTLLIISKSHGQAMV